MERRIRRKINATTCEVLDNNGVVIEQEYIVRGHITAPRLLVKARREFNEYVTIRNVKQHSVLYGMTEDEFIQHAAIIEEY